MRVRSMLMGFLGLAIAAACSSEDENRADLRSSSDATGQSAAAVAAAPEDEPDTAKPAAFALSEGDQGVAVNVVEQLFVNDPYDKSIDCSELLTRVFQSIRICFQGDNSCEFSATLRRKNADQENNPRVNSDPFYSCKLKNLPTWAKRLPTRLVTPLIPELVVKLKLGTQQPPFECPDYPQPIDCAAQCPSQPQDPFPPQECQPQPPQIVYVPQECPQLPAQPPQECPQLPAQPPQECPQLPAQPPEIIYVPQECPQLPAQPPQECPQLPAQPPQIVYVPQPYADPAMCANLGYGATSDPSSPSESPPPTPLDDGGSRGTGTQQDCSCVNFVHGAYMPGPNTALAQCLSDYYAAHGYNPNWIGCPMPP